MISVDGIVWDPSAQIDLAEGGLLTDGMCSVVAAPNKTPSHSQLLQTIKGHHMSLVVLSWQMTWLESKSATDERRVSKESRNIAPEHRIEWENLMKISSHRFRENYNYRTKGSDIKKSFCHSLSHCCIMKMVFHSWEEEVISYYHEGKKSLTWSMVIASAGAYLREVCNILHLLCFYYSFKEHQLWELFFKWIIHPWHFKPVWLFFHESVGEQNCSCSFPSNKSYGLSSSKGTIKCTIWLLKNTLCDEKRLKFKPLFTEMYIHFCISTYSNYHTIGHVTHENQ